MNNKINTFARHKARALIVQSLYQWQVTGTSASQLVAQHEADAKHMKRVDKVYFAELLKGVIGEIEQLDAHLQPLLNRPLSEVNLVELAVLRLASYELLHRLDIPMRVVINEATELTKLFGTIEGYRFVNAVLDRLARETRQFES